MAGKITSVNLADLKDRKPNIDRARIDATSEDDIRRHTIEDGEDPDAEPDPSRYRLVVPAARVREKLGLSQQQFADLIGVPVGTVRNWEQDRVVPGAAARSLLAILWREPEAATRALQVA